LKKPSDTTVDDLNFSLKKIKKRRRRNKKKSVSQDETVFDGVTSTPLTNVKSFSSDPSLSEIVARETDLQQTKTHKLDEPLQQEEQQINKFTSNSSSTLLTTRLINDLKIKDINFDHKYGPYFKLEENSWKIGRSSFTIDNKYNMFIHDKVYQLK